MVIDIEWQQVKSNICYSIPIPLFANLFQSIVTDCVVVIGKILHKLYINISNEFVDVLWLISLCM